MQWDIDAEARSSADRHFLDTLAEPDLTGLTERLVPRTASAKADITDVALREIYTEMVREVQDLLRDVRFCTATGLMLLLDAGRAHRSSPTASPLDVAGLWISEAEMAVLLTNAGFPPPSTLATDRHCDVGDGQSLGGWFGGLLLDTALGKCQGLLDRLVVALWCRAELSIATTKAGELRYPTFNLESIRELRAVYRNDPAWDGFAALVSTMIASELVRYRHAGTHKRRAGSALNGGLERWHADETDVTSPQHKLTRGMTAIEHVNAMLVTYRDLVFPAVEAAAGMALRRKPHPAGD